MADPLFEFDPTSEDAANSPLSVWATSSYEVTAFNAPAPQQRVQWAESVDTEGSSVASRKHENRTISLTIDCLSAAALRSLQAKVAKIAREGGTAKLTLPAGEVVIFDLLTADQFEPTFDVTYFVNSGAFCSVSIALTAKPYGRGASTTLTSHTPTAKQPIVFTETGIKGDMPAVGYLRVNNSTTPKTLLYWGLRSRYYDSASTAALFYEAESGTADLGVAAVGPAGASGGGANKVITHTVGGTSGRAFYLSGLTHSGTYVALARVQADSGNAGDVAAALRWTPGRTQSSLHENLNDSVTISSGLKGSWLIVNLGLVTIPKPRLGSQGWVASFVTTGAGGSDDLHWDWVAFVPVSEGSGRLETDPSGLVGVTTYPITSTGAVEISGSDAIYRTDGTVWGTPRKYEGDYLTIPPAGLESRTLQLFVLLSGDAGLNMTDYITEATNLEAGISAQLTYVPRYLVVPEP